MRTDDHDQSRIQRSKKPSFHSTSCFIYPVSGTAAVYQIYQRRRTSVSGTAAVYQICQVYQRRRTCVMSTEAVKNVFCTISKIDFPSSHHSVPHRKRLSCRKTHNLPVCQTEFSMHQAISLSKIAIFPRRIAVSSYHTPSIIVWFQA